MQTTDYSVYLAYYAAVPVKPDYSHFYAGILAPCLTMKSLIEAINILSARFPNGQEHD